MLKPFILKAWFYFRPAKWLAVGTAISLLLSVGFVELLDLPVAFSTEKPPLWKGLLLVVVLLEAWVGSYLVPAWLVTYAIYSSFKRRSRRELLTIILFSYFAIIFAFAGLYYSMSAWTDYNDAAKKHIYYEYEGIKLRAGFIKKVLPVDDQRAFRGINSRLWSGVDWPVDEKGRPLLHSGEVLSVSVEDMLEAARNPFERVVRFISEARLSVLGDCLHFSVVTMTTLGYGDISPKAWYAKLAADVQVLSGLVLFVVALGVVFGNWWGGIATSSLSKVKQDLDDGSSYE